MDPLVLIVFWSLFTAAGFWWMNWKRLKDRAVLRAEIWERRCEAVDHTNSLSDRVEIHKQRLDKYAMKIATHTHVVSEHEHPLPEHQHPAGEHHGSAHVPRMKGLTVQNVNGEVWRTEQCVECGALELHEVS